MGFEVVGQPVGERKDRIDWGIKQVHAPDIWDLTMGEGIKVAILDTGVDSDHPDLEGNIKLHVDFTRSPSGSEDRIGHGTHVAGIIGAMSNDVGVIGIAPHVSMYCGKVLADNGQGSYEAIIEGIYWSIEQKVDIINMSLGSPTRPPQELYEAIKKAHEIGIIMVSATGNSNTKVGWPAMYDEVIAVSAMDDKNIRAAFSNFGIKNEIMAPGVQILSTYKDGGYAKQSGTSMATPIVTGCIALFLSYCRIKGVEMTLEDIHQKLIDACDDLDVPGRDDYTGYGIINMNKMIIQEG